MPTEYSTEGKLTSEQYLVSRVRFKIEAYRRKGNRYRWGYTGMATTAAVGAAAVPVLINLGHVPTLIPTVISLLVTILVGLEGLLHFREHWRNYDIMKSFLWQELHLYRAAAGPYRGKAASEAFPLFVERVEEEIAKERSQTIEMRTTRATEPDQQRAARQEEEAP